MSKENLDVFAVLSPYQNACKREGMRRSESACDRKRPPQLSIFPGTTSGDCSSHKWAAKRCRCMIWDTLESLITTDWQKRTPRRWGVLVRARLHHILALTINRIWQFFLLLETSILYLALGMVLDYIYCTVSGYSPKLTFEKISKSPTRNSTLIVWWYSMSGSDEWMKTYLRLILEA